jgi:hypothetical protein
MLRVLLTRCSRCLAASGPAPARTGLGCVGGFVALEIDRKYVHFTYVYGCSRFTAHLHCVSLARRRYRSRGDVRLHLCESEEVNRACCSRSTPPVEFAPMLCALP